MVPNKNPKQQRKEMLDACVDGRLEDLKQLVAELNIDLKQPLQGTKDLMLHLASQHGRPEVVKWLIEERRGIPEVKQGSPKDIVAFKDMGGNTPMHRACEGQSIGHFDVVKLLVELDCKLFGNGVGVLTNEPNGGGMAPISLCMSKDRRLIAKYLLEQTKVNLHNYSYAGGRKTFHMACRAGLRDIAELIAQKDDNHSNSCLDNGKKTPLHHAFAGGAYTVARWLIVDKECWPDLWKEDTSKKKPEDYGKDVKPDDPDVKNQVLQLVELEKNRVNLIDTLRKHENYYDTQGGSIEREVWLKNQPEEFQNFYHAVRYALTVVPQSVFAIKYDVVKHAKDSRKARYGKIFLSFVKSAISAGVLPAQIILDPAEKILEEMIDKKSYKEQQVKLERLLKLCEGSEGLLKIATSVAYSLTIHHGAPISTGAGTNTALVVTGSPYASTKLPFDAKHNILKIISDITEKHILKDIPSNDTDQIIDAILKNLGEIPKQKALNTSMRLELSTASNNFLRTLIGTVDTAQTAINKVKSKMDTRLSAVEEQLKNHNQKLAIVSCRLEELENQGNLGEEFYALQTMVLEQKTLMNDLTEAYKKIRASVENRQPNSENNKKCIIQHASSYYDLENQEQRLELLVAQLDSDAVKETISKLSEQIPSEAKTIVVDEGSAGRESNIHNPPMIAESKTESIDVVSSTPTDAADDDDVKDLQRIATGDLQAANVLLVAHMMRIEDVFERICDAFKPHVKFFGEQLNKEKRDRLLAQSNNRAFSTREDVPIDSKRLNTTFIQLDSAKETYETTCRDFWDDINNITTYLSGRNWVSISVGNELSRLCLAARNSLRDKAPELIDPEHEFQTGLNDDNLPLWDTAMMRSLECMKTLNKIFNDMTQALKRLNEAVQENTIIHDDQTSRTFPPSLLSEAPSVTLFSLSTGKDADPLASKKEGVTDTRTGDQTESQRHHDVNVL